MHGPQEPAVPCRIRVCESGCVHLQFGIATVHLTPAAYVQFVRLAVRALGDLPDAPPDPTLEEGPGCFN